jgi:hypothetical protein
MQQEMQPPPQVSFKQWCEKLHYVANIALPEERTGMSSTKVRHRAIPQQVRHWREFPCQVQAWKTEMLRFGLDDTVFQRYAGRFTTQYTTFSFGSPSRVNSEHSTRANLQVYFDMVNQFDIDFYSLTRGECPDCPTYDVYTAATAQLGAIAAPDMLILDGCPNPVYKVGVGESQDPVGCPQSRSHGIHVPSPLSGLPQ